MLVNMLDVLSGCECCILESPAHGPCCSVGKAWKRMVTKVCFVGEGFTRKPPKYERFIRPMVRWWCFPGPSRGRRVHTALLTAS